MAVKRWLCEVHIVWDEFGVEAETKGELIEKIRESFIKERHHLELNDTNIKNIQEIGEED